METRCMRGFSNSFLPDRKIEADDLELEDVAMEPPSMQYIEGSELELTWKTARRQRLKEQEDKIWSEFVLEKDVLQVVSNEDPYQFLEQLPEPCLKDLMDSELERMKREALEEAIKEQQKRGGGDNPRRENQHMVTFSELEQDDLFRIFDDERDEHDDPDDAAELEGIEEDTGPESPCTVREAEDSPRREHSERSLQLTASKSSENVAHVIESSIYCAKVKELRMKISEALHTIMSSVESINVACFEPQQLRKMVRRAPEFSSRFQRIHLYQIQRQVADIKRHNAAALPFAQHTQFQSLMTRISALHQFILHALNVFDKSIEQTSCLRESSDQLITLCTTIQESVEVCKACVPPHDFHAATELYNDDIEANCKKLQTTVMSYTERANDIVEAACSTSGRSSKKLKAVKSKDKKRKLGAYSKSSTKTNSKTEATARLSMYSLENVRRQPSKSKDLVRDSGKDEKNQKDEKDDKSPKSHRKSPKGRRPLMRDPAAPGDAPRCRRRAMDSEIHTMVEQVGPPSSHISRETSPRRPSGRRRTRDPGPAHPQHPPAPAPHSPTNSPKNHKGKRSPYVRPPSTARTVTEQDAPNSATIKVQSAKKSPKSLSNFMEEYQVPNLEIKEESTNDLDNSKGDAGESARGNTILDTDGDSPKADSDRQVDSGRSKEDPQSSRVDVKEVAEDDLSGCEVSRLLKQLCGGDANGGRNERGSGAKNAQLFCVNTGASPRQPSTPQLLRILEETIQKKVPKPAVRKQKPKDADRLRLAFNIPQNTADKIYHYRTKFVQHMLTSSLYANSTVGKPWEMIGSVSEQIIDEILLKCMKDLELEPILLELYKSETQ